MNHHLPAMPHGQPPMPPSRRQQDFPYNPGPPNMRSPPYMGYLPHMNGHMPPAFPPQQYPQWYPPYGHMQVPPRPYQPPYGPMIVSSYPHSQPIMAPNHIPPHSLPMPPRTSTPLQPTMSPSVPAPHLQPEIQEHHPTVLPVQPHRNYPVASPPPRWEPKVTPAPKPAFSAPVSSTTVIMESMHFIPLSGANRWYSFLGSLSQSFPSPPELHTDVERPV